MKKAFLLMICVLALTMNIVSQVREISRDEYYQVYRTALKNVSANNSRKVTKKQELKDGKINRTVEIIDEFLQPDSRRYISVDKFNNQNVKSELIKIGKTYYCRKNESAWTQSEGWCVERSLYSSSSESISKYSVQNTKINNLNLTLYQNYTTDKYTDSKDKKEKTNYWQEKLWLDNKGFLVRAEIEAGIVEPKEISLQLTDTYEYDLKDIKIEAPKIKEK